MSPADAYSTITEARPDNLVVLDVRTPEEFEEQHLADAVLVDFHGPDFADRIADLDRDATYVMYCRSGNRSGQAREMMQNLGFSDVRDIDGGILSWLDQGLPVETSSGS